MTRILLEVWFFLVDCCIFDGQRLCFDGQKLLHVMYNIINCAW